MTNRVSTYPDNKDDVASLWKSIFNDSDDFTNLFFSRVYKPENTLVIKKNDIIVSSLQMIPYKLKTSDKTVPSAYICGVCTRKSEQGKGYMKILMNEAMEIMKEKKYAVSTLIPAEPWLFDFYKQFGYTCPINHKIEKYFSGKPFVNPPESIFFRSVGNMTGNLAPIYSYFNLKQSERHCAVLHNEFDFETLIADNNMSNGNVWVALKNGAPVGMAFCIKENDFSVSVNEFLYDDVSIKNCFIGHLFSFYKTKEINVRTPFHGKETPVKLFNVPTEIHKYGLACNFDDSYADLSDIYMTLMLD